MVMIFVALFLGAIVGGLLGKSEINALIGGFLTCFLILPVMSFLRLATGSLMARAAGVRGEAPFAWPMHIRYLIGAVVSAGVALVTITFLGEDLNVMSGALMACVSASIMAIIMAVKVSLSE